MNHPISTPAFDDLHTGGMYCLRYVKHSDGTRYDTLLTMPLELLLVTFERGKPCQLRLWSKESGRVEVSWLDVLELLEVVKARIAE